MVVLRNRGAARFTPTSRWQSFMIGTATILGIGNLILRRSALCRTTSPRACFISIVPRVGASDLATWPLDLCADSRSFSVIARERDLTALSSLGRVTFVARGRSPSFDRAFVLVRVEPSAVASSIKGRTRR